MKVRVRRRCARGLWRALLARRPPAPATPHQMTNDVNVVGFVVWPVSALAYWVLYIWVWPALSLAALPVTYNTFSHLKSRAWCQNLNSCCHTFPVVIVLLVALAIDPSFHRGARQ